MPNAVIGDYGDLVMIDTGNDLSDKENLKVYITKPDGTQAVKTSLEGVTFGTGPNGTDNTYMNYRIESGLLDIDGDYLFSAYFEDTGVGKYSQGTPVEYEVKRRNQTP